MSLPYIEENFISSDECQRLIDFADANKKENISQDDVYSTEIEWIDHGATYYGNNVDPVTAELDDDAVIKVTEKCKTFADCELIYAGVVRWPVGTFMKPHFDTNTGHKENILAAMKSNLTFTWYHYYKFIFSWLYNWKKFFNNYTE